MLIKVSDKTCLLVAFIGIFIQNLLFVSDLCYYFYLLYQIVSILVMIDLFVSFLDSQREFHGFIFYNA